MNLRLQPQEESIRQTNDRPALAISKVMSAMGRKRTLRWRAEAPAGSNRDPVQPNQYNALDTGPGPSNVLKGTRADTRRCLKNVQADIRSVGDFNVMAQRRMNDTFRGHSIAKAYLLNRPLHGGMSGEWQ